MKKEREFLLRIEELEAQLADAEQLIDAIRQGQVDAFALKNNNRAEIYTLHSGDYAYRVLVENFSEGALNLSEDGLIVYTNSYFHTLIGQRYEDVIGQSIFDFVHTSSQENFKAIFKQGLAGTSKGEVNLYDGTNLIPVYVSFTSLQPNLPTIGLIVTDLSEKRKHEHELAEKNNELAQSNSELASFSYIASHDLQEPLRKIQTFSHRILDRADQELQPDMRDYFERILHATARMKNLITDLLNYSRMGADEKAELSDLNVLVHEALSNLEERIEASKATFTINPLPTVQVIPYQIIQLFTNIFSNAIKYRKVDIPPMVFVTTKIVQSDDYVLLASNHSYHKISIADNGLGFDQMHADKIFELFQRLHGAGEYEGTGIGLAICKRILQNHKGFVQAEGVLGVGAVFHIYLPIHSS